MKRIEVHRKCIEVLGKIEYYVEAITIRDKYLKDYLIRIGSLMDRYSHKTNRLRTYIDYLELKYQKLKHQL